jgi:hypothetical protein
MTDKSTEEIAKQIGQQIGQELNQGMDSLFTKLSEITAKTATEEVLSDPGLDEFAKFQTENMMNNAKRTYDEYQRVSLEGVDKNRVHFDKIISDSQEHTGNIRNITTQALQNAVETQNMVAKQAVRHGDIAIDRQWNVDEQAGFVAKILNSIQDPAMATAMAAAIAKVMMENAGNKTA